MEARPVARAYPAGPMEEPILDVRAPPKVPPAVGVLARLEFIEGPLRGQSRPITTTDLLIGRGSACDIRLEDRSVSRIHARLRYAQGAWFIQDQGSSGGTFVNDEMIQAKRLKLDDRVTIGDTSFKFWK